MVVVHDAARPLAGPELFPAVIAAVPRRRRRRGPGLPVTDTVKRVGGRTRWSETVPRDGLVAVQTPQAFGPTRSGPSTRPAATPPTTPRWWRPPGGGSCGARGARPTSRSPPGRHGGGGRPAGTGGRRGTENRVGLGFDVHPFGGDGPLVLAGVQVEGQGLSGHSDADVVAHAVADAILGAAGLPDLGTLFPASDDRYAGADSMSLLAEVVHHVQAEQWRVANVDVVIVAEAPHLAPHLPAMTENLFNVLGAPTNVKPKRAEGLGALGRVEGMAAMAVALLEHRPA